MVQPTEHASCLTLSVPRMTGIELLQAIRNDPDATIQSIPFVMLSASLEKESELVPDGSITGPTDFLVKVQNSLLPQYFSSNGPTFRTHQPFSSKSLISIVQERLRSARQTTDLELRVQQRTAELELSQLRYRRISELSPVAIFETDESNPGLITYAVSTP